MSGLFLNVAISAFVGALASVGTVWYLSANSNENHLAASENAATKIKKLETETLVVNDSLLFVDPETQEPLVEIRDGKIFAQRGIYAEHLGAWRVTAQKLQTTPEDPLSPKSAIFGELAVTDDGGGYLALMSPKESHSVTIGFDRNEKGCVVSQNNEDHSVAAQAVFFKPTQEGSAIGLKNASASTSSTRNVVSSADVRADARDGAFLR